MVVKIKSRVMAPLALLVPELEEAAQVVKQIFTSKAKIKVLKLLRSESSIKMARPAISSILRANS